MSEQQPPHRRPMARWSGWFDDRESSDVDPLAVRAAAERAAVSLVRGARTADDAAVAERVLHLAETEGLETLAELWADAPPDSVAGCLWRLYLLRTWTLADPVRAAREFDAGRRLAPVAEVVAGVADPPGPDELRAMVDDVLRGVVVADLADVLFRAAAYARVVATGRGALDDDPSAGPAAGARLLGLADQLDRAGRLELEHRLG